uniref:Type I restriction modification DNA specificity domain-containing protein n=1 Tax=Candidatus Methanogaster sp. ANME-2c ERB4 TaxID=2759911 RepID=A0A7G9YMQ4_9EURY|nr:hypothetical protein ANJBEOKM_00028 [Methanosarcinales archaeon ANME-2c ERB4]
MFDQQKVGYYGVFDEAYPLSDTELRFKDLGIVIPSIELVDAFQKDIKPFDDKIIANCIQIHTLEKMRDMLLPKLMSGELRVRYER